MKKLNYLLLGLAGLTMASCSQDDLQGPADGTYQITVNLPSDIATRAIGDTPSGQILSYTLFQVNSDETLTMVEEKTDVALTNNQATLDLPLVKGYTYQIAFFACTEAASSVYSYSEGNLEVTYANMTYGEGVSADAYDCFSGSLDLGEVTGAISESITLNRPVAQINWGTTDLSSAAVQTVFGSNIATELTAMVPSTLNILEDTYGEATTTVTLPSVPAPAATEAFPVEGYSYLAMQYVLAPTSMTSNLTLQVSNSENNTVTPVTVEVANAPLQANYRTNIYGALLTDQANVTVSLGSWGTPSNDIALIWDGKTSTTPTIDTEKMTVAVNAASDLAGLADIISGEKQLEGVPADLKGYTITLAADYDLNGNPLSLGSATRASSSTGSDTKPFSGTFDGNGKTISGLKIEYTGNDKNAVAAFIPNLDGAGEVKNVTFDNVYIDGGKCEQAGIVGLATNGATISGVTVSGGSITATEGAGGIVGRMIRTGSITNCTNSADITVTVNNAGGIVGAAYYTQEGGTMTISGCINNGNIQTTGTSTSATSVGGIVGTSAANILNCTNNGNVIGYSGANSYGGIVGFQVAAGSIESCTNKGIITGGHYIGGIVGKIGYNSDKNAYPFTATIKVTGNTNYGNVTGTNAVGGILGFNVYTTILSDNNTACSIISGTSNVAGIVGIANGTESGVTGNLTLSGSKVLYTTKITGDPQDQYANGEYTGNGNETVDTID